MNPVVPDTTPQQWKLPAHAAEVVALFAFPHGADCADSIFWRTYENGQIVLRADCSDTFAWGTADSERIDEADMPLLRECAEALKATDRECMLSELFAARKRNQRPMDLFFEAIGKNSGDAEEVERLFPSGSGVR